MAARKLVLGGGYPSPDKVGYKKLGNALLRGKLLDAIRGGATIHAACTACGVSLKQYQYRRATDAGFTLKADKAQRAGLFARLLWPEKRRHFLAACKWLCGIDIAREACGLTRFQLLGLFEASPDFQREALAAQAAGLVIPPDAHEGATPPALWGRTKLIDLMQQAAAIEAGTYQKDYGPF